MGAKAGGPNYVMQFAIANEVALPQEKALLKEVNNLTSIIQNQSISTEELGVWYASIANYAFFAKQFAKERDPSKIIGQDNVLCYRPHKNICFRIQETDKPLDILRVLAAAFSCLCRIEISFAKGHLHIQMMDRLKTLLMSCP